MAYTLITQKSWALPSEEQCGNYFITTYSQCRLVRWSGFFPYREAMEPASFLEMPLSADKQGSQAKTSFVRPLSPELRISLKKDGFTPNFSTAEDGDLVKKTFSISKEDTISQKNIIREIEILRSLYPGKIHVFLGDDLQVEGNRKIILLMPRAKGKTFNELLSNGGINRTEWVFALIKVGTKLQKLHDKKIIHRDIKPGNLMWDLGKEVTIIDYGSIARYGTALQYFFDGTSPLFLAPEIANHNGKSSYPTFEMDVYAFTLSAICILLKIPETKLEKFLFEKKKDPETNLTTLSKDTVSRWLTKTLLDKDLTRDLMDGIDEDPTKRSLLKIIGALKKYHEILQKPVFSQNSSTSTSTSPKSTPEISLHYTC